MKKHVEFLDAAITIHTNKEYSFLVTTTRAMFSKIKQQLLKDPTLIKILQSKDSQSFIKNKIKIIQPNLSFKRKFCNEPICDYSNKIKEVTDLTKADFEDFGNQTIYLMEAMHVNKKQVFGSIVPFSKSSPKGIVTSLLKADQDNPHFYQTIVKGFLTSDIFLNTNANIKQTCTLNKKPPYDIKKTFKDKSGEILATCRNQNLNILYNEKLKQPFLTSTFFISYVHSLKNIEQKSSVTLGVNLDPILINLALSSPDTILFISKNGKIRYYKTDGTVNLINRNNINLNKILNNKEGFFINKKKEKIFFTHIANITKDDGYIVLIETEDSRTQIINQIINIIKEISKTVAIRSGILIIAAMILITLILSRIISAITHPIVQLSNELSNLNERKIGEIKTREEHKKKKR